MEKNILVFCAHADDTAISMGGAIPKFIKEGHNIIEIIFSYGELHYLKKEVIIKKRVNEIKSSGSILGYKDATFLGLPDGNIASKIEENNIKEVVKELINKHNPVKIFTHSPSDPMPDHRTVNKVVYRALKEIEENYDLYCFDVWNLSNFKEKDSPKMIIDISDTFNLKIKALKEFKSQAHIMIQLAPAIFLRAKWFGLKNGCKYAERFYKIM